MSLHKITGIMCVVRASFMIIIVVIIIWFSSQYFFVCLPFNDFETTLYTAFWISLPLFLSSSRFCTLPLSQNLWLFLFFAAVFVVVYIFIDVYCGYACFLYSSFILIFALILFSCKGELFIIIVINARDTYNAAAIS